MILELRRIAGEMGTSTVRTDDFNRLSVFEEGVVRRRFGSWKDALRAAGLDVAPLGRRYSDAECFENLLKVWTHHGRAPFHRDMSQFPSAVGPKAYVRRWGTWTKGLHAFVSQVNEDISPLSDNGSCVSPSDPTESHTERDKRDIRLGLRYSVLKSDRFRCAICGVSPATSLDCRLHVDHIVPFSKGGTTEVENLRTLCEMCNLGKAGRLEGDAQSVIAVARPTAGR